MPAPVSCVPPVRRLCAACAPAQTAADATKQNHLPPAGIWQGAWGFRLPGFLRHACAHFGGFLYIFYYKRFLYGWISHKTGFGFLDLAPSILHSNWF
jgi:hypothetical protein